ncbi:MAG TPA: fibronectin type III domain-containing protein, partial [Alphaproteobacteria bacterium]|nr:fibronectin type III domain-containing protein [Alphaproteobacteria bacterium]
GINGIPSINTTYAQGIPLGINIMVDASDPTNEVLYVSSDPGVDGGVVAGGTVIRISNNATAAPQPPGVPGPVASANGGDSQAFVSWVPGGTGTVTSYTVRTNPGNGSVVPDVVVNAPATSATITGLTNGVTYNFQVSATNAVGTSAFSTASNTITVNPITVPSAPTGVSATAGDSQATVSWTPPASNGNATITSYGVTARVNGTAVSGVSVGGTTTSVVYGGLTNGTTYTFTVHAVNSQGASPESAPSNPVTPVRTIGATDMAISMSGPSNLVSGANATYTLTINNLGPNFAPQVVVTDNVPPGATFVSSSTSQGACGFSAPNLLCNLGAMASGGNATVTITLNVTSAITNTASVQGNDLNGAALGDPNPVNNSASLNTAIGPPPTTTDLQVSGSAQNGGPTAGPTITDTFTWQVKNAQNQPANLVVFTVLVPAGLPFNSVSTNNGVCSGPPVGGGGTITCNASTIAAGTTMIVTVNVSVPTAGTFASTGQGSFNGTDTNNQNNTFTVTLNAK